MMNDPQDDRATLDSKYSLVIAVSKRARDIVNRREHPASSAHKPVTIALDEINRGKLRIILEKEELPEVPPAKETDKAQETQETQAEPFL